MNQIKAFISINKKITDAMMLMMRAVQSLDFFPNLRDIE